MKIEAAKRLLSSELVKNKQELIELQLKSLENYQTLAVLRNLKDDESIINRDLQ